MVAILKLEDLSLSAFFLEQGRDQKLVNKRKNIAII